MAVPGRSRAGINQELKSTDLGHEQILAVSLPPLA